MPADQLTVKPELLTNVTTTANPIQSNSILCQRWPINYLTHCRIDSTGKHCHHQRTQSILCERQTINYLSIHRCCLTHCRTAATADPDQATTTPKMIAKGNMKSKNRRHYDLDGLYHNVKASGGRDHCHYLHKKDSRELKAYKKERPKTIL